MNRKFIILLYTVLLVSAGTNVYLFKEAKRWKAAWVNQLITTSEIESILKSSAADISLEGIRKAAISQFGEDAVRAVEVEDVHIQWGSDNTGLKVNETLLLFKDGIYHGSKANLP